MGKSEAHVVLRACWGLLGLAGACWGLIEPVGQGWGGEEVSAGGAELEPQQQGCV